MKFDLSRTIRLLLVFALVQSTACAQVRTSSQGTTRQGTEVVTDSALSLEEAFGNQLVPDSIKKELRLISVRYYSFDGKLHQGQLLIHQELQNEIVEIFNELQMHKFPIAKVIPIAKYEFSDEASMADNNTSAFNYRLVEGTAKLSNHAIGRAIDLNPLLNPSIRGEIVDPPMAKYDPNVLGTIVADGIVVQAFKRRGWSWGGDWKSLKDYQHFEKVSRPSPITKPPASAQ